MPKSITEINVIGILHVTDSEPLLLDFFSESGERVSLRVDYEHLVEALAGIEHKMDCIATFYVIEEI